MVKHILHAAVVLALTLGTAAHSLATSRVDGLVSLTPVVEHSVIAVEVQVTPGTPITGLRWYHNDANVVFPHVLLVEGELFQPPNLSETAVVLEDVGGSSLDWSEVLLPTPITSSSGVVHVVFELPANVERTGDGLGGGPAIGYHAVAGGARGYLSADGENWTRLSRSHSLAVEPIAAMMRDAAGPMTLSASRETIQEGWWTRRRPTEVTDLTQESADPAVSPPFRAALRVASNPFNPRTEVSYAVDRAGEVALDVFDARGRRVRTLLRGHHEVGTYQTVWDGTDQSARSTASGVYYMRLHVPTGTLSERVVLLR